MGRVGRARRVIEVREEGREGRREGGRGEGREGRREGGREGWVAPGHGVSSSSFFRLKMLRVFIQDFSHGLLTLIITHTCTHA